MSRPVALDIRLVALALYACASGALACSSTPSPASAPQAVSRSIGAVGGQLVASDGTGVSVPAGALGTATTITVTPEPGAPTAPEATPVGTPFLYGPEGQTFSTPVTVTLAFDPRQIPEGKQVSDVLVYTAPWGSSAFATLPTTVVDATHVSAETTHFSIFVAEVPLSDAAAAVGAGDAAGGNDAESSTVADATIVDATIVDATMEDTGHSDAVASDGPVIDVAEAGATEAAGPPASGDGTLLCPDPCPAGQCPGPCPSGWTLCGQSCTVLSTGDINNCGACGHTCLATESCRLGLCVATSSLWLTTTTGSSNGSNFTALTVDDTTLCFVQNSCPMPPVAGCGGNESPSAVGCMPKHGGPIAIIASGISPDNMVGPVYIATDDTYVYWTQWVEVATPGGATPTAGAAAVLRAPKDGSGSATTLVTQVGQAPFGLAVDSKNAYFSIFEEIVGATFDAIPLNGGSLYTVYSNPYWDDALGTAMLTGGVGQVVSNGTLLFLVGYADPVVSSANIFTVEANGSTSIATVASYGPGSAIQADATRLAYVGGAGVGWVDLADGGTQNLSIAANNIALHPCGLVWDDAGVFAAPAATLGTGSAPWTIRLVTGVSAGGPVVTDGESIYWIDAFNGPPTGPRAPPLGAAIGWLPLPP